MDSDMAIARQRSRAAIVLGILLGCSTWAFALDPSLDIDQYAHTAWRTREGFSKGVIQAIAQTPDGYIWLATQFGLLRFDGARTVVWPPPTGEQLPSNIIYHLITARDGTLWIGTTKGLASWKNGKLTQYAQLAGEDIFALLEDDEGTIWAGTSGNANGRLCAIQSGRVQCYGEDGKFEGGVLSLYEDSQRNLWVGASNGVWRWKPGPPTLNPEQADKIESLLSNPGYNEDVFEGDNGQQLIAGNGGIKRPPNKKTDASSVSGYGQKLRPQRSLRDRDGGLWIGTLDRGLVHEHDGRQDVFTEADGLSGDRITGLFEDSEGDIWVSTYGGLDRFRDFAIPTISVKQGLSNGNVWSVLGAKDGSVWLGTFDGLNRWDNGHITIYRKRGEQARRTTLAGVHEVANSGLPDDVESLSQDDQGRIWVSTHSGLTYFEDGRFVPVDGVPGRYVHSITADNVGSLWISHQKQGLLQMLNGSVVARFPWVGLGRKDYADAVVSDPVKGGLWLGFIQGAVAYFKDGQVRASYPVTDRSSEGSVAGLQLDRDGTLWAATGGGLSRVKNGRIATLTSKNGLPCDAVHWIEEDDAHSFWLFMACGLVRIDRSELDAWSTLADKGMEKDPTLTVKATLFDTQDGVKGRAFVGGYTPHVARSTDGKVWFSVQDGVSVIDPRHLAFNNLPPPVHVEQITADHKTYWQNSSGDTSSRLPLPARSRDLEIDYTALSFVAPEKVRFRYKLEGWDRDWQDAGNRRQAFYTNLSPRNYRFRVMASNNSGVWNETGASFDFSVAPAWYQTVWFRAVCVAVFVILLWSAYQLRVRQLAYQFSMTLDARVNERTRIARDLHDTLLQSFHGLLLSFQTAYDLLPTRAVEARQSLGIAIDEAAEAITESRDAVQGLRSSTGESNDLAEAIRGIGEELVTDGTNHTPAAFRVELAGTPLDLCPAVRDEVYRIAGEALRNAFRHAQARQIEVEVRYDERQFLLRVRDDGKGIDPEVLGENGRTGHFGLHGMRERAKLAGGKLKIWSGSGSGTEIELTIPASTAYGTSPRASWWYRS